MHCNEDQCSQINKYFFKKSKLWSSQPRPCCSKEVGVWGAQLLKFSASQPPITPSYYPAKTSVSLNLSLSLPAGGLPLPRKNRDGM